MDIIIVLRAILYEWVQYQGIISKDSSKLTPLVSGLKNLIKYIFLK